MYIHQNTYPNWNGSKYLDFYSSTTIIEPIFGFYVSVPTNLLKVLEFCSSESFGGLELYFTNCCKRLNQSHVNVHVIAKKNSRIAKSLANENISITYINKRSITALLSVVKKIQPDIIHVHHKDDIVVTAVVRYLYPRFKYVHTRQMDFPRKKFNPYHRFIYRSMDLIITITDRLRNQMIQHLQVDPEKVRRLYYGVNKPAESHTRCDEIKLNKQMFNIGVIARLDDKKQQHVVIEALKKLNNATIYLHFIGGTTNERYADQLHRMVAQNGLNHQVHFHGFIDDPPSIMPCFDLIVLPTAIETFGLVLPEAMRMGVAVIGANGGGVPEIIDHDINGLLFDPGNSDSLKDCLLLMMDRATRQRLAKAGKQKADAKFEINMHFKGLQELFESTLNA